MLMISPRNIYAKAIDNNGIFDNLSGDAKYLKDEYLSRYYLDTEEMGILDSADAVTASIANIMFGLVKNTGEATVSTFYNALTFNLADNLPDSVINSIQSGLVDGIFDPLYPLAFCAVAYNLIALLSKRDYSGLTAEIIKTVVILVSSMLITTHSSTALKTLSTITSKLSTAVLVEMNGGASTEDFAAESAGLLWVSLVHIPWESLEFYNNNHEASAYDSGLVEDILNYNIDDDQRKTLIENNLDGGYFSKKVNGARVASLFCYMIPFFLKCILFIGTAAVTIPLQALTILIAFFAPLVLLLSLVPGFGGYNLIARWAKKLLVIQLMALFAMMLLGFIFIISNAINSSLVGKGWFLATLIEIICFITLFLLRNQIFGLFGVAAATVSGVNNRYRGYNNFDSLSNGVRVAGIESRQKMNEVATNISAVFSTNYEPKHYGKDPVIVKRPSTTDKTKAELAAEAEAKAKENELAIAAKREAEAVQRPRPYLYPPKAEETSESSASIILKSVSSGTTGQTLNIQQQPEQSINVVRPEFSSKRPKATASSPPATTVPEKATAAAAAEPVRTSRRTIANDSSGVPYVIADAAAKEQPATVVERPVSTVEHSTTATSTTAIETGSGNTLKTASSGSSETVTRTHMKTGIETGNIETVSRASSGSGKVSGQAQPKQSTIKDSSATVATVPTAHNVAETSGETATQTINRIVQADVQRELEIPGNTTARPESSSAAAQVNNINAAGQAPAKTAHVPPQTQQPVKKGNGSRQRQPVQHSATATVGQTKDESTTSTLNKVVQGDALKSLEVPGNTAARPESSSASTTKSESTTAELNKVVQGDVLKQLEVPGNTVKRPESSSADVQTNNTNAAGRTPAQAAQVSPQAQESSLKHGGSQQQPVQHNTAATVGQTKAESTTATLNKVVQGDALKSLDVQGNTVARPELSSSTSAVASKPKSSDKSGAATNNNINNHTNSIPVGRGATPVSISNSNIDIPVETSNQVSRPESAALNIETHSTSTVSTIQVEAGTHDLKQLADSSGATLSTPNIQAPETPSSPAIVSPVVSSATGATAKQPAQKSVAKEKPPEALERTGNTPASMEMNAVYIDNSSEEVKKKSLSEQSSSEKKEVKGKAPKQARQRQTQAKIPPATKEIPTARQKPATQLPDAHTQPMQIQIGKDSAAPEVQRPSTTDKRVATKKKPQQQPASEKRKN